jgi:hypothetical protein
MAAVCRGASFLAASLNNAIDGRDRDGRPAGTTGFGMKPSNRTVGTSVQSLVPIIDHEMEEEDHHHERTAVRGQTIVVYETSGRSGSCSFVCYGIAIVIVIIAMHCAVVGDGIVGRAFLLRRGTTGPQCTVASYDPS